MKNFYFSITFGILIFFVFELKAKDYSQRLQSIKQRIEENYYSFNYDVLNNISEDAEKTAKSESSWQINYYRGLLNLMMGKIIYNKDKDAAYSHFEKSVNHLENAFKMNENAEIAALLSSAYGKKSSLSIINAFFLGIKAKNWIYKANDLTVNSAKINLIAATHLMHLPEFYGGDKNKAEALLKKSLKITEKNENEWFIKWADTPEIYAYLAQLEILRNNPKQAEFYINQAIIIIPDYGFINYDLKVQLKKIKK